MRTDKSLLHVLAIAIAMLVFSLSPVSAQASAAETEPATTPQSRPVRTDSPRDTLRTFLRLRDSLETALLDYRAERSVHKGRSSSPSC